jgi:hypothetical protein
MSTNNSVALPVAATIGRQLARPGQTCDSANSGRPAGCEQDDDDRARGRHGIGKRLTMDQGVDLGTSLPAWLLYPGTLLLLMLLVYPFYRTRNGIARFGLFALCFRYLASAYHDLTFKASPIGLSYNALGSSAVFMLGLLFIKSRHLLLKPLIPCYLMMAVVVLSGIANHDIPGVVDVVVKYGYLVIVTIIVYEGLSAIGERRMMNTLLWSSVIPLLFQALSIAFGIVKLSEADGSASYIGGYNHEAAFSICLATSFVIACFASGLNVWVRGAILIILIGGMLAANYRTTIVAFAPLVFIQFNLDVIDRFPPRQRAMVAIGILTVSGLAALGAAWVLRERFADLATTLGNIGDLMKPQSEYTLDQRHLLSNRAFIWSGYIYAWIDGGFRNHVLGFGPDSWVGVFSVYAHNTLISQLYEYGIVGVVAIPVLWATMLFCALRAKHGPRGKLLAAHISFFILNMATMPHWMIEGDILYGIICGYTLYLYYGPATVPIAAKPAKAQGPRPRLLSADPEPAPPKYRPGFPLVPARKPRV